MRVLESEEYLQWFNSLRDTKIKHRVVARIERLKFGLLGDTKSVGDGVSELRLYFGAGYRIYYTIRNGEIIILLTGGDKSTQSRDIARAKELAKEYQ